MLCNRPYYGNKRCSVCHSGDHSLQAYSDLQGACRKPDR
ncbi:hypothetical protein [Enterobacter cloacae]